MTAPAEVTAPFGEMPRNSPTRTPVDHMYVTDQHGREWEGHFDLRTLAWVSALHLVSANPPVDIPPKYLEPIRGQNGRNVSSKIVVNERRWLKDTVERLGEWRDALLVNAKRMYPNNFGEMLQNPSRDLLVETGPGPIDPRFIEAMIAGNKWALGLTDRRPPWVTDEMLEGAAALKRSFGWRSQLTHDGTIDPSLYPDADDEDVEALDDLAPVKRGPGRPRKGT